MRKVHHKWTYHIHMRKEVEYKAMQIAPSSSSLRKWKLNILCC